MEARQDRVHPLLDDKILSDWNGLIMAGLAKAGRIFEEDKYINAAEECWNFLNTQMMDDQHHLKHRYRNGDVAIDGHADDYAFVIWGLIELYQTTFNSEYLKEAIQLNEQFIQLFWDDEDGGFYFTSESAEKLLGRKKEIYDGAMPSSNSIAMMNLLRLGRIVGNTDWEQMADEAQKLFAKNMKKAPTGFGAALQSVDFTTGTSQEIIIAGNKQDSDTKQMLQHLKQPFLPRAVQILNDPEDNSIRELAPYLSDYEMIDGSTTAYVCQNYSCELPTNDPEKMMDLVNDR